MLNVKLLQQLYKYNEVYKLQFLKMSKLHINEQEQQL